MYGYFSFPRVLLNDDNGTCNVIYYVASTLSRRDISSTPIHSILNHVSPARNHYFPPSAHYEAYQK